MRLNSLFAFTLLSSLLLFSSCKPAIDECGECFAKKFNNAIRIVDIAKKNGVEVQKDGYTLHEVYFSCTIEFIEDYNIKSPVFGVFESFAKGDRLEIENAHAQFIKTDNGWLCNDADYNAMKGVYYIDPKGNRVESDEYHKRKAEEEARRPRNYTGWIDNYMQHAALKLRVIDTKLTGTLYNKSTHQAIVVHGYVNRDNSWHINIGSNLYLKGDVLNNNLEGVCFQGSAKIGKYSFREVSLEWEQTKALDAPHETNTEEQAPPASYAEAKDTTIYFYVTTEKAYFYDQPNATTIKKAYLIKGERIKMVKEADSFVYTEFTNAKGIVTKGWLLESNLSL